MNHGTKTLVVGVATLAALVSLSACGNSGTTQSAPSSVSTSSSTPAPAHNQADVMFAHHMIPHHQQAIQMSDVILAKSDIDPRVLDLAKQIKAAQGPEIEQMQGWLSQWGAPMMMPGMSGMPGSGPGHGGMTGMPGPGMGNMPGMAGMMSPADMQALQNAQGVQAGKLFLTQMIAHHQGAITMAQNEIKNGQYPDAVEMSKSIISSQQKEIDTMNQILNSI